MNRKNLTAAVLAGLAGVVGIAGSAQAVNINPDGLGQVLLYPYYTTNGGNVTVLSVVNTTENAKAVKVRFLEGQNSREVLDFNLYMSKYDVWTAALVAGPVACIPEQNCQGTPTMITLDSSCTVPYIYGNGGVQEFLPWALTDAEYLDVDASGNQTKEYGDVNVRGSSGHFEMIEMGTLVNDAQLNMEWVNEEDFPFCDASSTPEYGNPSDNCIALDRNWTDAELAQKPLLVETASAANATHKDDGLPLNCQALVDAWTVGALPIDDGYWIVDPTTDITAPSGGLFGGAAVINVNQGAMYSYDARAVDGFQTLSGDYVGDYLHQEPGTILPSLDSGNENEASIFFNGLALESIGLERGVDAVSYVLMHDAIMNEYTTQDAVGANTEWVITFPTKQFYVHQMFLDGYAVHRTETADASGNLTLDPNSPYYDTDDGDFIPVAPFTTSWTWVDTVYEEDASGNNTSEVKTPGYVDYPCEVVQLDTIWDREEQTIIDPDKPPGEPIPPIVSPAPPPVDGPDPDGIIPFELCYETSVIAFGDDAINANGVTRVLASRNYHTINNDVLGFETGWARLDLWNATSDLDGSGAIEDDEILFRDDLGGLNGLPVTGFAVNRFVNSFLGGGADVLANYGGIFTHKGTRKFGFSSDQ